MAGFKITLNRKTKKILNKTEQGMVAQVRKEFKKKGPSRVNAQIKREILRGVSPVKGKRFVKYSKSYLLQIKKKIAFFTSGGKVIPITSDAGISTKEFKSLRPSKQAKRTLKNSRASNKALIAKLNAELIKYSKRVSPRNMKVSGKMLKALRTRAKGGILSSFRLEITWKHFLAAIHNTHGAGKSKVIRRLLPDKSGEKFNKRINDRLFSELKKATEKVAKRFS